MNSTQVFARPLVGFVLLLIGAWSGEASGQEDPLLEDWRWVRFGMESGLPTESVLEIVESQERIWAATTEGMAWFDGFRWNVAAVSGLDVEVISDVAPDHRGGVYVAASGTLYHVSRLRSEVIPLTLDGTPISPGRVATTGPGELYFAEGPRAFRWDGDSVELLAAFPSAPVGEKAVSVELLGIDGALWAMASSPLESLFELVGSAWVRRATPRVPGNRYFLAGSSHSSLLATWSPEGSDIWLRTPAGAETRHVGATPSVLSSVDVSDRGDVVLAYGSGQVEVRRGGRWALLPAAPTSVLGITSMRFAEDGNLWVAADGGIYLNRAAPRWLGDGELQSAEPIVNAVLPTTSGDLWVAGATGVVVRRSDGRLERLPTVPGASPAPITALAEDREGGIWVGSGGGFDGAFRWFDGRWRHYGPEQGLGAQRIHQIVPDSEGRLWFLGLSAQLSDGGTGAFVLDRDVFERWSTVEGLIHDRVYDFVAAPDGSRWFATLGGLSRLREGEWTHWTPEDGLRHNRVFTVAIDSSGRLWFGHGAGVVRGLGFVGPDDRVEYVASNDPLALRNVWDLAIGRNGALWVSTKSGLGVMRNGVGTILDRKHGLKNPLLWPVVPGGPRAHRDDGRRCRRAGHLGGGLTATRSHGSGPARRSGSRRPSMARAGVSRAAATGGDPHAISDQ